jgi:hypothetical protein
MIFRAYSGEKNQTACNILIGNSEIRRESIAMNLNRNIMGRSCCIHLAQARDQWQVLVNINKAPLYAQTVK